MILRDTLWILAFFVLWSSDPAEAGCAQLPSHYCFVDCTKDTYSVVCENVTDGNGLQAALQTFSGLNASFSLRLWNSPAIKRFGLNLLSSVKDLIVSLELQNLDNVDMFPEIQYLSQLKNLTIQRATNLRYLPMELLPSSIEQVILRETGITEFLNENTVNHTFDNLRRFVIENQLIASISLFFTSFPSIESIEIKDCHIIFSQSYNAAPFLTQRPLRLLRISDNTFESNVTRYQFRLFEFLIQNLHTDQDSSVELAHNDFPIGKRSVQLLNRISQVQKLSLRGSPFEDYNTLAYVFSNFSNLRTLDLGETSLPNLKGSVFHGLKNLEELYLDGNDMNSLTNAELFRGLEARNLSVLDFSNNKFYDLPSGFEVYGKNLLKFNMNGNHIVNRVFGGRGRYFPKTQWVGEGNNRKEAFAGKSFAEYKSIKWLDMSCNPFTNFTEAMFRGLPDLEMLNLTQCTGMQRDRPVVQKGAFKVFPKVKRLILARAFFKAGILTMMQAMSKESAEALIELDLSYNKIAYLHKKGAYFRPFTKLEVLNLKGNLIQSTGEDAFSTLPNLKKLDLSDNGIFSIGPSDFSGLFKLEDLSLNGNNILFITPGAFDNLTSLKALFLSDNNITDIMKIFSPGKGRNLTHFGLSGLPLPCFPPKMFVKYRSLKWVYTNYLPVFLDADPTRTLWEQMEQTPPHRWAKTVFCEGTKTMDSFDEDFSYLSEAFVRFLLHDPENSVYQEMYAHFATCYEPGYRGVREKIRNKICLKNKTV